MNRLIAFGVAVVVLLYVLFSSIYIVNIREQAIVMRFGRITEVRTEPGLYFKLPTNFVDTVQVVEDRLLRYDIMDMELQVEGGATYVVDAFLTYRIANAQLFRERAQGNLEQAERRIETNFDSALRTVYGTRDFDDALSAERVAMMTEARDLIRPALTEIGIEVTDVRIVRTDLAADISQNTFERMSAERLAQAAAIRAGGQQAAQSLRAIADRQAVEVVAGANRDSEILRGEGDAQRNAVFAQAFTSDPEFFAFYRSLESYRTALGSSGTTLVLSPDSEFFRYFEENSEGGVVPAPAAPNGIAPLPTTSVVTAPTDVLPPANTGVDSTVIVDPAVTLDQATPAITPEATASEPPPVSSSVEPVPVP